MGSVLGFGYLNLLVCGGCDSSRGSPAAALFELAVVSTRTRLIAADERRCGNRRRGRSEVLPFSLFPPFLAFESLPFGLPAFGDFLLFEHPDVPDRFPLGELLRGQRLLGRLAPDVKILLRRVRRAHLGRAHVPGRDALPAPVGLLLLAASFGPLLVGQIEPGIGGRSRVYGIGPRGLTFISLSLQLGGCGWLQHFHSLLQVRREGAHARHLPQPGGLTKSRFRR